MNTYQSSANSSSFTFHPYSHPKYIAELQKQKRDAFDQYLTQLGWNAVGGCLMGLTFNFLLIKKQKKPFQMIGLFTGLGTGYATN